MPPKPKYTAAELLINGLTVGAAIMRGGTGFTDAQKRRLERIADNAKDRGQQAAEK
jgi:hypothetical protein